MIFNTKHGILVHFRLMEIDNHVYSDVNNIHCEPNSNTQQSKMNLVIEYVLD